MEVLLLLLLIVHFLGLGLGFAGGVGHGQVIGRLAKDGSGSDAALWNLEPVFSRMLMIGFALLLVSGPLLVWLKYSGSEGLSWWFWLKMAAVVVAFGSDLLILRYVRAWRGGDESAARMAEKLGGVSGLAILVVVVAAVFNFG